MGTRMLEALRINLTSWVFRQAAGVAVRLGENWKALLYPCYIADS